MPPQLLLFAAMTLTPAGLIALSALWGGGWTIAALAFLIPFTVVLDRLIARTLPATAGDEFPAATWLTTTLGALHFPLLALTTWAVAMQPFGLWDKTGLFVAAALFFGQVSNANAHELIHRPGRGLHGLGKWVYISLLFGHHTSAHPLVHHVHAATRADPSTARLGEGYYRFALRAWRGSFREGWRAETRRSQQINRPAHGHPYVTYVFGGALCMVAAVALAGPLGLAIYLGLALSAQSQLLLSDYVQHYGLVRHVQDGRPEPMGPRHSWNSPHILSSALTMNAPRHSDHHMRPGQTYLGLVLPEDSPSLPRSLPVMATLALAPPLWRRVMDPLARKWAAPDVTNS